MTNLIASLQLIAQPYIFSEEKILVLQKYEKQKKFSFHAKNFLLKIKTCFKFNTKAIAILTKMCTNLYITTYHESVRKNSES